MKKKEQRILTELTLNSRQAISSLAKKVGVSKEVARYTMRNLEKSLIKQYYTIINHEALGFTRYGCWLQLKNISPKEETDIIEFLAKHPHVNYMGPVIGKWNLAFDIIATDKSQLTTIKKEIITRIKDNLVEFPINTSGSQDEFFPTKMFGVNKSIESPKTKEKTIAEIDKKILFHLAKNARIEYSELSQILKLTANAIKYRIKQLEKNGIILGYTISVDPHQLGMQMYNLQVKLTTGFNERLRTYLRNHPKAWYYYRYFENENWDVDIGVLSPNITELREFMIEIKENFGNEMKIHDFYVVEDIVKDDIVPDAVFAKHKPKRKSPKKESNFQTITEGLATVQVETADIVSKDLEVFYNPDMKLNRDLTLEVLKAHFDKPIKMALPLAGTGIRAVRLLKEVPELVDELHVNDLSPDAVKLINENLKANKVKAQVHNDEATVFLDQSQGYDYIDIDPFGSPNQFLDTAIRKISRNGILAVTATDTAALAGTYPSTCKRKYWAKSVICPQKHEVGMRILARKVMLLGIHHSKILTPVFSYHYKHYYRIFFIATKGKEQAAKLLDNLNTFLSYNRPTEEIIVDNKPIEAWQYAGPMYNGSLQQKDFLEKIKNEEKAMRRIIDATIEDAKVNVVGYYDMHLLCKKNSKLLKKMEEYQESLSKKGFTAVRAATNPHALKTDAPFDEIVKVL